MDCKFFLFFTTYYKKCYSSKPNLSSSPREKIEKPLPAVSKEASKPSQKVSTPALQSDKDFPLTNPKILDSNTQPQAVTGAPIDFTLSQPKKLESLSINSQQVNYCHVLDRSRGFIIEPDPNRKFRHKMKNQRIKSQNRQRFHKRLKKN